VAGPGRGGAAARSPGTAAAPNTVVRRSELLLLLGLTVLGLVARAVNMLHSPGLTAYDDEGIYVAQAWAVLREGQLSPYTFVYDHAPAGWILLAGWMGLVGGPHAFGSAIDTGRVFVVALGVLSLPLLYGIARRLGCSPAAAGAGAALYGLSPLATFYGRLVLLDTIMVFWLLLSVAMLLASPRFVESVGPPRRRWSSVWVCAASGVCYGLAVLTKETALVFAPAVLVLVWLTRHHRATAIVAWLLAVGAVVSVYLGYAAARGELLPSGPTRFLLFNIDGPPHISLLDTLAWQASRDGGGPLNFHNMFWELVRTDWLRRDPILFGVGALAAGANLLRGLVRRRPTGVAAAGLLGVLPLLYLGRGGLVYGFYVLAAVPWLCLNLAVALSPALALARRWGTLPGVLAAVAVAAAAACNWHLGGFEAVYARGEGADAREAVAWVKQHVPPESAMIINDNWWTDLREPGMGGPAFPRAHSHWKVALETGVRRGVFRDDWRAVDYLLITAGTKGAFVSTNNAVAQESLRRARLLKSWGSGAEAIELWQVDHPGAADLALLLGSAATIAHRFGQGGSYPLPDGTVTAQHQAAAMLRAVWTADRSGFAQTWQWTKAHLLTESGVLASTWQGGAVADPRSSSDADTDAALALLLASKRWDDPELEAAGREMVRAIWRAEVATAAGTPYLTAGTWATQGQVLGVRLSHLAPYAYHVFQEVDPEHDWLSLVASSYKALSGAADLQPAVPAGGWVGVERASGTIVPFSGPSPDADRSPTEAAAETYWRIALHRSWTVRWSPGGDGRATAYLERAYLAPPHATGRGTPGTATAAGQLAVRLGVDPLTAPRFFASEVAATARQEPTGASWGDPNDLPTQRWGWLATALYAGALVDLWHTS
jgi:4-amino-4-deoxy-L-arabinose transferase-like glycosyltransferase